MSSSPPRGRQRQSGSPDSPDKIMNILSTPKNNGRGSSAADANLFKTPITPQSERPKPVFRPEPQSFSTKKERGSLPRSRPPPRPMAKTCPPVSRVFKRRPEMQTAQSVTFANIHDESSVQGTPLPRSAVYDSAKKASYFEQAFTIEALVGAGCFGNVFRVKSKEDNGLYAVKIAREAYRGTTDRAQKLEEVRKHQLLLPHFNCVHFYQSWEEKGRLYQQFELCESSLMELAESEHEISESRIWSYLVDLLLAVEHLHDHGLIHMDIKPENIFIGRDGRAKLGDFGLVIDLAKDDTAHAQEGDPRYLATEILESKAFTKAADIFSLGVTILELACDLDLPKHGPLWHKLRKEGPDPALLTRLSHDLRRVIQLMMTNYSDRRPTVKQMLQLPAVQKEVKRRQRQLAREEMWSGLVALFTPIIFLAVWAWNNLCLQPVAALRRFWVDTDNKTPPNSIHQPNDDSFKSPQMPEVSSTDHLAKFYIGDHVVSSSSLADEYTNSELSSSFLDKSSSSQQNSPLARPLTLNFSDDSDEEKVGDHDDDDGGDESDPAVVSSMAPPAAGSTPKLSRSTPGGPTSAANAKSSALRFRQRISEAQANAGSSPAKNNGLSSPKKRLDFDQLDSGSPVSSKVARALNGGAERSPRLSTATTARTPMTSSLRSRPERFYTGRDTSDDEADQEQDFMNTPRSHSRRTKVHFHRSGGIIRNSAGILANASPLSNGDSSAIGSELAGRAMGEGDLDDHLGIKPLSLVAKFDAFSDDTENDE